MHISGSRKYPTEVFLIDESIDPEEFIIATYALYGNPKDYLTLTGALALEQTTGTWVPVAEETPEVRRKHGGKAVSAFEVGIPKKEEGQPRIFVIKIAFPIVNLGYQIPEVLSAVFGNISMGGNLKLLDLQFPKSFTEHFTGPNFGIEGVRKILGVWDRPLVMTMTKPCTGIPPSVVAKLFYESTRGGVDIVKDDELLADPSYCDFKSRLKAVLEVQKKAEEETGEKKLYAINVTDEVNLMIDKARWAVENGVNCIMVNVFATGFSGLRALAEDKKINVPLVAHPCMSGAYYGSPYTGINWSLLFGKFLRLSGADMVVYPSAYGKIPLPREDYLRVAQTLQVPFHNLKPAFPGPAAGTYPGMAPTFINELGIDFMMSAGGAIHGHPMGPAAGGKAMRQAIEVAMQGRNLRDAAKEYKELKAAIELWGIYGEDVVKFELKA